jgi:GAF domain-containing protein
LPVKTGTQIRGIITVISKEANHFTPERVKMLLAIADGLGMLLENSRLSQDLRASAREIAVVDEVARIITSTLEINQVYEKFALEMRKLVDFDRASINFVDQETGTYTLLYLFGESRPGHSIGDPSPLEGTYTQQVVKTKQTRIIRDLAEDLGYTVSQKWLKLGFRSNIIAPLISKGRAIGTLSLRSHKVDAFGLAEQTILERLAHQIVPAIENARLYQQLQAHTKEMAVVDEVARIITSTLEIDQVCEEFTREMRKLVDFERAAISMVNREADTFTVQYVFGDPRSGHPVGSVMPLAGNLTGELVKP